MTPLEYLKLERAAEFRSDFYDGAIHERARSQRNHSLIITNLIGELGSRLKKSPCSAMACNMRVKVAATNFYSYPDFLVVCGETECEDEFDDTLLNPHLIIEVFADATETFDRGKKFENYRQIPSLREYVLIAQDCFKIEQYLKQESDNWQIVETANVWSAVYFPSINCEVAVAEIYDKVNFQ